jgi:hypothetical protein
VIQEIRAIQGKLDELAMWASLEQLETLGIPAPPEKRDLLVSLGLMARAVQQVRQAILAGPGIPALQEMTEQLVILAERATREIPVGPDRQATLAMMALLVRPARRATQAVLETLETQDLPDTETQD